jgi:hypothetical protein
MGSRVNRNNREEKAGGPAANFKLELESYLGRFILSSRMRFNLLEQAGSIRKLS